MKKRPAKTNSEKSSKNNKRRKMVIAGSTCFHEEAAKYKNKFEQKNHQVVACMEPADAPRGWHEIYADFYDGLSQADDIFVLNLDKKGVKGYIGYETFAEMSSMVVRKINGEDINIYLHQWPDKSCGCYDEIMEMAKNGWIKLLEPPSE